MKKKFACPCCGHKTLNEPSPGSYQICKICHWEDDIVQFENPNLQGGANHLSLNEAIMRYKTNQYLKKDDISS